MDRQSPTQAPAEAVTFTAAGFRRAEWLLVLTAVALAVCAYGLRLQDSWLVSVREWFIRTPTGIKTYLWTMLEPLLSFFLSPLIFKGALAAFPLLGFIALCLARRLLAPGGSSGARAVWISVAAFIGWCIVSAAWSPTPDIARDAAYFLAIYGTFFFLLLRRGVTPGESRQFAVLLIALGFIVILILYMQALPFFGAGGSAPIFKFMYFFKDSERNQVGSLLGHNTAAASYILMTFFPAAALFLGARTRGTRIALGIYLAMAVYSILLAQSRSIWVLGPVLGVLAMRSLLRGRRGRRWLPTLVLTILAFGLLSQTINRPWNPFYIRTLSLAGRLQDLTAESLKLESRLRLNVIGIQLVPEHPLKGHGLFAFQYVYPRKQGEYFNSHPDSQLNRTAKRSNMAHNEYLQTLVDHGLIGLALMLWVVWEIAKRGWALRRPEGGGALLHEAFGWSSLGLALHALFDFPFHIAQLMLPGMICMACWGALLPGKPADAVATGNPGAAEANFRPRVFARLLAAFSLFAFAAIAAIPLVRVLQGDVLFNSATGLTRTVSDRGLKLSLDTKVELLERSALLLNQAKLATPSNYGIDMWKADTELMLGQLFFAKSRDPEIVAAGSEAQWREQALRALQRALQASLNTTAGLDFHYIHFRRSHIYSLLAAVTQNPEFRREQIKSLQRTLSQMPFFIEAAYDLSEAMVDQEPYDREAVLALRKRIYRFDPNFFNTHYVMLLNEMMKANLYERALPGWQQLLLVDPANGEWLAGTVHCALKLQNAPLARQILDRQKRDAPDSLFPTGMSIVDAALNGQWDEVLMQTRNNHFTEAYLRATQRAIEDEARRRLGSVATPIYNTRPDGVEEAEWARVLAETRPEMIFTLFQDPRQARIAWEDRMALGDPEPGLDFWLTGARIGLALRDAAFAARNLDQAARINPSAPAIRILREKMASPAPQ